MRTKAECEAEITAALAAYRDACECCACPDEDTCSCGVKVEEERMNTLIETYRYLPTQRTP